MAFSRNQWVLGKALILLGEKYRISEEITGRNKDILWVSFDDAAFCYTELTDDHAVLWQDETDNELGINLGIGEAEIIDFIESCL